MCTARADRSAAVTCASGRLNVHRAMTRHAPRPDLGQSWGAAPGARQGRGGAPSPKSRPIATIIIPAGPSRSGVSPWTPATCSQRATICVTSQCVRRLQGVHGPEEMDRQINGSGPCGTTRKVIATPTALLGQELGAMGPNSRRSASIRAGFGQPADQAQAPGMTGHPHGRGRRGWPTGLPVLAGQCCAAQHRPVPRDRHHEHPIQAGEGNRARCRPGRSSAETPQGPASQTAPPPR